MTNAELPVVKKLSSSTSALIDLQKDDPKLISLDDCSDSESEILSGGLIVTEKLSQFVEFSKKQCMEMVEKARKLRRYARMKKSMRDAAERNFNKKEADYLNARLVWVEVRNAVKNWTLDEKEAFSILRNCKNEDVDIVTKKIYPPPSTSGTTALDIQISSPQKAPFPDRQVLSMNFPLNVSGNKRNPPPGITSKSVNLLPYNSSVVSIPKMAAVERHNREVIKAVIGVDDVEFLSELTPTSKFSMFGSEDPKDFTTFGSRGSCDYGSAFSCKRRVVVPPFCNKRTRIVAKKDARHKDIPENKIA